jgi:hypothetical protein
MTEIANLLDPNPPQFKSLFIDAQTVTKESLE